MTAYLTRFCRHCTADALLCAALGELSLFLQGSLLLVLLCLSQLCRAER